MPANDALVGRVRAALATSGPTEEKRMFGGVGFMLGGKLCVAVGKDRILCRIDPDEHDAAVAREGCETMVMRGRPLRGYVRVSEEALRSSELFDEMLQRAIRYNPRARRHRA